MNAPLAKPNWPEQQIGSFPPSFQAELKPKNAKE
jgi:hypothetical protein